jgi:glucokinase
MLGIDIGGTRTKWVRCTPEYAVLDQGDLPTPRSDPVDALAKLIGEVARTGEAARAGKGARAGEVTGAGGPGVEAVGIAVPGRLSDDRRRIELLPNLPDWPTHLADELQTRTGVDIRIVNDARAFALAELTLGVAQGERDAVFVTMGTGIGGALALNGRIVRARGDAVGELGHMVCRPGGKSCGCGARGCLETYAGGWALVSRMRARGSLVETPEGVVRAAAARDPIACDVLKEAGAALGLVLGNVVAYTGVTTVVVGGGVAPAFTYMRPAVEAALEQIRLVGPVNLRAARLGSAAGALGAALTSEGDI